MTKEDSVSQFLSDFKIKMKSFDIIFRDDRTKNTQALLLMELTSSKRREIIESLAVEDYVEGPQDDKLYGKSSLWVFGKKFRKNDIYIKITMGGYNASVICISFHTAEKQISYPLKN